MADRGGFRGRGRGGDRGGRGGFGDRGGRGGRGGDRGRGGGRGRGRGGPRQEFGLPDSMKHLRVSTEELISNYYSLETKPNQVFYKYVLKFQEGCKISTQIDRQKAFVLLMRQIFNGSHERTKNKDDNKVPWDDLIFSGTYIITQKQIPALENASATIPDTGDRKKTSTTTIQVSFDKKVEVSKSYGEKEEKAAQQDEQILDYILQNAVEKYSGLQKHGRKYVDYENREVDSSPRAGTFVAYRGWKPSVQYRRGGWLLLVGPTTFNEVRFPSIADELKQGPSANTSGLIGKEINLLHRRKGENTAIISGIATDKTLMSKMDPRTPGDQPRTFLDYYKERYPEKPLVYRNLPLVMVKSEYHGKEQVNYFPAELCEFSQRKGSKPSDEENGLTEILTAEGPGNKIRHINKFIENLNKPHPHRGKSVLQALQSWGLNVRFEPVTVPFKRLPPQDIILAKDSVEHKQSKWTMAMRNLDISHGRPMNPFLVLYDANCEQFARTMGDNISKLNHMKRREGKNAGIDVKPVYLAVPPMGNPDALGKEWVKKLATWAQSSRPNIKTTLAVLCCRENTQETPYSYVCRWCAENNVQEQFVVFSNHRKRMETSRSFPNVLASNLFVGLQAKLGGCLWKIEYNPKVYGQQNANRILMIGADVYHDQSHRGYVGPSGEKWPSVLAYVGEAPMGMYGCFYSNRQYLLPHGQELGTARDCVYNATRGILEDFGRTFKGPPRAVIFYRDGVGDQTYEAVKTEELERVKTALRDFSEAHKCGPVSLTYFIIQKRLSTRFFTHEGGNPVPGTVVEEKVTRAKEFCLLDFGDFMMTANDTTQGTARPVHYDLIYNDIPAKAGISFHDLQVLTFQSCHMFQNYPGIVKVPSACRYADAHAFKYGRFLLQEVQGVVQEPRCTPVFNNSRGML
eukprot:GCRY01000223.1.p1 GENE.GCRY01000223.1~~GCRY01000223.1.p1  ORF type:complete len:912 (+),score=174.70 GCRY01000223.1:69-2804(+)